LANVNFSLGDVDKGTQGLGSRYMGFSFGDGQKASLGLGLKSLDQIHQLLKKDREVGNYSMTAQQEN